MDYELGTYWIEQGEYQEWRESQIRAFEAWRGVEGRYEDVSLPNGSVLLLAKVAA